ncbi:MAG: prevent-host-death family protein [Flavobacteriales bacterium]|jgi:prevent-host-death family protein
MQIVNISDFRSNLLKYLENANAGEEISVSSNGRVLATITMPIGQKDMAKERLRELALTAKVGDVTSPSDDEWDAML